MLFGSRPSSFLFGGYNALFFFLFHGDVFVCYSAALLLAAMRHASMLRFNLRRTARTLRATRANPRPCKCHVMAMTTAGTCGPRSHVTSSRNWDASSRPPRSVVSVNGVCTLTRFAAVASSFYNGRRVNHLRHSSGSIVSFGPFTVPG